MAPINAIPRYGVSVGFKLIDMCDYPNCSKKGEYLLGIAKAKRIKPERIIGRVCAGDMRKSIDNLMHQCFGTLFWVAVYDLEGKLLYHSFDADKDGYAAAAGWELFFECQK